MSTLYASHFRLREAPFSIAPNPRFLFMSEQHRDALAHLVYGIRHDGGFVLLTGEVGTGKTTLCRCLLERIPRDTDAAFIINPRLSVVDLLANICDELHIDYPKDTQNNRILVDAINHYLLARHAEGRKTVLVIDEAQNLDTDVLEQLRLLTNLETVEHKLLQIILLGQPELQDKLAQRGLRQLSQRITARCHLRALSHTDMQAYIAHRLTVAGCEQEIFTKSALNHIYKQSRGIPRLINLICDRAMLGAYAMGRTRIERGIVHQAAREVFGAPPAGKHLSSPALIIPVLLLMAVAAWSGVYWAIDKPPASALSEAQIHPLPPAPKVAAPIKSDVAKIPASPPAESQAKAHAASVQTKPVIAATDSDFLQNRQMAFASLLNAWGQKLPGDFDPCAYAATRGLACLQQTGDLGLLRSFDRPAVLTWQDNGGTISYVALLGINDPMARVAAGSQQFEVPLTTLQHHWLGKFTILWREPDAYRADIQPGTAGPSARWLNERLAMLDAKQGQSIDKADIPAFYAGPWVERLRRFQRDAGLPPDGVADPRTLIELNTLLHTPGPRVKPTATATPASIQNNGAH